MALKIIASLVATISATFLDKLNLDGLASTCLTISLIKLPAN